MLTILLSFISVPIDKSFISKSFSAAAYGNSIIAIIAGLIANKIASMNKLTLYSESIIPIYIGGYLNPFDAALVALIACGIAASLLWKENFGEVESNVNSHDQSSGSRTPEFVSVLQKAFTTTVSNPEILLCGFISSFFEGSMYIFVFMWTPALTALTEKNSSDEVNLPFGLIFSTFMVCCMAGSSLFSILSERMAGEHLGVLLFAVGSLAMATISMSISDTASFLAMNVFEVCVGMYFPIMGTMKGSIVPESQRSAIYNLYRIPLNFIVLASLLTDLKPETSFKVTSFMLATALVLQLKLAKIRLAINQTLKTSSELKDTGV